MSWTIIIIILGLCLFEIISSIDNAIVNAHVLKTMPEKYRKIFLFWGILFAIFLVRGFLPFLIVWLANPALNPFEVFTAIWSNDPKIISYLETSKGLLLLGGGIYLWLTFLSWLFLEEKKYAFLVESFIHKQGLWFYSVTSLCTVLIVYLSLKINPLLALAATIGLTAFFITDGFRKNAEKTEKNLLKNKHLSAWSKILYLEILDASFSIDGVIGAFAFTMSVPIILVGNGLGAIVVREFTVKGINLISRYAYLKNGAMYSIGMLGAIMIAESLGQSFPFWLAPLNTIVLFLVFFILSIKEIKNQNKILVRKK